MMNRHQRRAGANKAKEIDRVRLDGEWISITSPKLDPFCNAEGDLVIPGSDDQALVIKGWRSGIRQVPS